MNNVYSRRSSPNPDTYRYDLPEQVRWRVLHTIKGLSERWQNSFEEGNGGENGGGGNGEQFHCSGKGGRRAASCGGSGWRDAV